MPNYKKLFFDMENHHHQIIKPKTLEQHFLSTEKLALTLNMKPQSIRKRFNQTGSYFGIKPIKLPNGRLCWPANAVELLKGEQA